MSRQQKRGRRIPLGYGGLPTRTTHHVRTSELIAIVVAGYW